MGMSVSNWRDQRDIPDSLFGKYTLPGCECTRHFTCRVCLVRTHMRNVAEQAPKAGPRPRRRRDG